jgi:integral membrane protein
MEKKYTLLRRVGYAEAASYLLLLLIAMPLKYIFNLPLAVAYTGWIHGVLFVLYLVVLLVEFLLNKWSFKVLFFGGIAALLPFGPLVFDRKVLGKL